MQKNNPALHTDGKGYGRFRGPVQANRFGDKRGLPPESVTRSVVPLPGPSRPGMISRCACTADPGRPSCQWAMPGSQVTSPGQAIIRAVPTIRASKNGVTPLNTVSRGTSPAIPLTTKALIPTGGVMIPI
jgi:hypothetical protein